MILRPVLILSLAALVCSVAPVLSAQTEAVVSAGSAAVPPGEIFDIPVSISSVTDLYDFQFDLSFDPGLLQLESVSEGSFLPSAGTTTFFPGITNNTEGTATFILDSLIGPIRGASGNGTLATLHFQGVSVGTSALTLSNVVLQDSTLAVISFATSVGSVTVVPEPRETIPLLLFLCAGALAAFRAHHSES